MAMGHKHSFVDILEQFPQQIKEVSVLGDKIIFGAVSGAFSGVKGVVLAGMGGSGLPGEIVKDLVENIPVFVVKDYKIPKHIGKDSLVFVISYSGNTEEALAMYEDAQAKGLRVVAVASGGELVKKARADGIPCVIVPAGLQPRMAYGYQTVPVLDILARSGVFGPVNWDKVADFLEKEKGNIKKRARELASAVSGKIPLIYSSESFSAAAYKWKINFNENAKMHAFCNYFPEFNHNEINGYVQLNGKYCVFILHDNGDNVRVKKRMDIVGELVRKKKISVVDIESEGFDATSRLFWAMWLGDWVSYYTAADAGVNPEPVDIIESLKKKLK